MCPAVPPSGKERGDSVFVFPQRFNTSDAPELCPDEVHLSASVGGSAAFQVCSSSFTCADERKLEEVCRV